MALISNLFKSYCYGIGNLYDEYIESLYITMNCCLSFFRIG